LSFLCGYLKYISKGSSGRDERNRKKIEIGMELKNIIYTNIWTDTLCPSIHYYYCGNAYKLLILFL